MMDGLGSVKLLHAAVVFLLHMGWIGADHTQHTFAREVSGFLGESDSVCEITGQQIVDALVDAGAVKDADMVSWGCDKAVKS